MSSVILISPDDLRQLVREAVSDAMAGYSSIRGEEWVPLKKCGLPPTTVRRLIKDGKVKSAKVGRETRVSSADLNAYMQAASAKIEEQVVANEVPEPIDAFERARARAARRSA